MIFKQILNVFFKIRNSIVLENESPQKSTKSEDIILNMLRPDEEQINTTGINGNGKNRLKKLWSMNIFL